MTMRKPQVHPDAPLPCRHKRAVTRRDFLAQGLISGVGLALLPNLASLLRAGPAAAQVANPCGIGLAGGMIPFIAIDLAGGANIAGSNVLVGGPGGQLDLLTTQGYQLLGLPASMTPQQPGQVNTELGLAFHADSPFLAGIISKTAATTRANVNGVIFCARSENDTDNNPHNPVFGINKAGANGDLVALIGTSPSDSGGNSEPPMSMYDPSVRPTKVDSPRDATGMVDTGKLITLLNQQDAAAVAATSEEISQLKLDRISETAALEQLIRCGYTKTTDLITRFGDPNALNPLQDPLITGQGTSIFSAQEIGNSRFLKTASVMKLVLNGFAGAGTIEQGGYDYHDGTRATGEVRDFLAGQMMGSILEYAARLGRPVALYVLSDGSLDSDGSIDNSAAGRGKGNWRGDNSSVAATFMLAYSPAGRPPLTRATANQIGYYRSNGNIESAATRVSNNVALLAEAVVLNYLALHNGGVARFASVLPSHGLGATAADLDALTAFTPIL
jgi:hypothetical protein